MNEKQEPEKLGTSASSSASDWEAKGYGEFGGEVPRFIGIGPWSPEVSKISLPKESSLPVSSVTTFEAALTCVILEDAIKELVILKYVIGDPMDSTWDLYYKSRKDRFSRRLTPERIFPESDGKPILTPTLKLQRDRELVESALFKLLKALQDRNSIVPIVWTVDSFHEEIEDENQLISELKENLSYVQDLKARVKEKRRLDDLEEQERDEFMYQLQDEMDDVILKCEVEEKFVQKWENVRVAQNQWKLRNSENFYKDNITKLNTKTKVEKRVTHELQLYLKFNQAELEEQLEECMSVYDLEMERRENKIIQLKYERDQKEEMKVQLRQLYEDRKREMKEWVIFRDNRKRKMKASLIIQKEKNKQKNEEEERKGRVAHLTVYHCMKSFDLHKQRKESWWRGMMVRKKLGPYKQKKQKPEATNTKKK